MTRPGGITPRGFPYPGSTGVVANTPSALQALAEAITGQLGSIGPGVILQGWAGSVSVSANVVTVNYPAWFPKLASVVGLVGNLSVGPPSNWTLQGGLPGQMRVTPVRNRQPSYTGSAWIELLAWGPAK